MIDFDKAPGVVPRGLFYLSFFIIQTAPLSFGENRFITSSPFLPEESTFLNLLA